MHMRQRVLQTVQNLSVVWVEDLVGKHADPSDPTAYFLDRVAKYFGGSAGVTTFQPEGQ